MAILVILDVNKGEMHLAAVQAQLGAKRLGAGGHPGASAIKPIPVHAIGPIVGGAVDRAIVGVAKHPIAIDVQDQGI